MIILLYFYDNLCGLPKSLFSSNVALFYFLACKNNLEYLQIDSNTDGLVDFREFVAATLHVHQLEEDSDKWQQLSQAAFEKFDLDKDGYITPEELRMVGLTSFVKL